MPGTTRSNGSSALPEDRLTDFVILREAINDAPDALDYESYPVETLRAYDAALIARRQTSYTVVARRHPGGEPAGISMVVVDELAPTLAHQEDTSVVRAHRGHRLGLLMKLDMIDWLRAERPDVRRLQTWNDATNAPMLNVNAALGLRPVHANSAWVRRR